MPKNVAAIVTTTKTQRVILGPAKPHDAEDADGDTGNNSNNNNNNHHDL